MSESGAFYGRQARQIGARTPMQVAQLAGVWALAWRPGDNTGTFCGKRFRPLSAAVAVSLRSGAGPRGREQVLLAGYQARMDPATAEVHFGGAETNACLYDLAFRPKTRAGGLVINPSKNPSLAWLGLELDQLRVAALQRGDWLHSHPVLPAAWLGFHQESLPPVADSPALRARAARLARLPEAAIDAMPVTERAALLAKAWDQATVYPGAEGNTSDLYLVPAAICKDARQAVARLLDFDGMTGQQLFNPASRWTKPRRSVPNPARAVAAHFGIQAEDVLAPGVDLGALYEDIEKMFFKEIGEQHWLTDPDDVVRAFERPDQPLRLSGVGGRTIPDEAAIRLMRDQVGRMSECCSDDDLLEAARNPGRPLQASGLGRAQVLRVPAGGLVFRGEGTHADFGTVRSAWSPAVVI